MDLLSRMNADGIILLTNQEGIRKVWNNAGFRLWYSTVK